MPDIEQAKALFMKGTEAFAAGQLESASDAFKAALALAPGRPSLLQNLGATLFQLGRDTEAITVLQQAVAAEPFYGDSWLHLGLALQRNARWVDAAAALDKALPLLPDDYALRLACATCHYRAGNTARAMAVYDKAIKQRPDAAAAWIEKGNALRELGMLEQAAQCFETAAQLGVNDELNNYYLAAVSKGQTPASPPRRYVESLFDDYAGEFQNHLVDQLGYTAHTTLCRPLTSAWHDAILDLGCGTGLCGEIMHRCASAIDGVDVSNAMLAQARELKLYRELQHEDLNTYLSATAHQYNLVLAADVFIYVGDLQAVFAGVRRVLAEDGVFAFSVEISDDADLKLLPSLRYAHSEHYIRRLADAHGFSVDDLVHAPLRVDQKMPVMGLYVYLKRN